MQFGQDVRGSEQLAGDSAFGRTVNRLTLNET